VVERARIVLLSAEGLTGPQIAWRVGCSEPTVIKWRRQYAEAGLAGLEDARRPGGPKTVMNDEVNRGDLVRDGDPAAGGAVGAGVTHWSARRLAGWLRRDKKIKVSHDSITRLWRRFCLQPHRTEGFKFSTDPRLDAKVRDVVGLYLDPPENAVVLCVDEKSQWQAYPGGESGVRDGGQESDLTQSSFSRGRVIQGASATGLTAGDGASRVVPGVLPSAVPRSVGNEAQAGTRLVVDASLTDAYASDPPAETTHPRSQTPDNQALERSQPILPMRSGIPERQTHDYVRHGVTSLFAALNVATGQVTDACYPKHRHQEFLKFLKKVAAAYPAATCT